jgi:hypothetical protein
MRSISRLKTFTCHPARRQRRRCATRRRLALLLGWNYGRSYGTDRLDAALVGRAAAGVVRDTDEWAAWGAPAEVLQQLKYLWHILVAVGRPYPVSRAGAGRPGPGRGHARD